MYISLADAPIGKPLELVKVENPDLALRLRRMGLFEGSEIKRLDGVVLVRPIRVKGPKGPAVLGGGMGTKIVVHLDDGRKLPLIEMQPGETGHIEGITDGRSLSAALQTLGLNINDKITFIRKLPPMEYVTIIEKEGRTRLTEGMAAKIWGRLDDGPVQFVSARKGHKFYVEDILGGKNARQMLASYGIEIGKTMILEGVEHAQTLFMGKYVKPLIITTKEGLRLFLERKEGKRIFVQELTKD